MYRPHTWVEINLDKIADNLNLIKAGLKKDSKIIGVVKADAYGFGAIEVSRFLVAQGVAMLAVSVLTEGIELRRAGITVPILIFNYINVDNYDLLFQYDLTPTVYSYSFAQELNDTAKIWNKKIKIHVNVDTGMSRLGVLIEDLPTFMEKLKKLDYLLVEAIYSHFSTADADNLEYTQMQLDTFNKARAIVNSSHFKDVYYHIANSAALMRGIACDFDYVRIGAAIYGFNPKENMLGSMMSGPLNSALTFKTIIGYYKKVKKNVAVSYGATFYTQRETIIATLPLGYADGVRRILSNKGEVLVKGKRARIIGVIAMDQLMIDITDIEDVKTGEEVIIIGKQGEDEITLAEVAALSNTISYEVPALINRRVPRYYLMNNKVISIRGHLDNL